MKIAEREMERVDWRDHLSVGAFIVRNALMEDRALEDAATGSLGPGADKQVVCSVVAREKTVVAGWFLVKQVYSILFELAEDPRPVKTEVRVLDGGTADPEENLGVIRGSAGTILRGERVALNLMGRLSGIASLTARYVEEVKGTGVQILDTRKTTPCLRALEKYAVRTGGGTNHRFDLLEMAMLKDNHLAFAGGSGSLEEILRRIRHSGTPVEIEVDDLGQLADVLKQRPDRVLLDNMTPERLRKAVRMAKNSGVYLEASGGITLSSVRAVAETGVHGISSGALTHSAPCADIGFDWGRR